MKIRFILCLPGLVEFFLSRPFDSGLWSDGCSSLRERVGKKEIAALWHGVTGSRVVRGEPPKFSSNWLFVECVPDDNVDRLMYLRTRERTA